MRVDIERGGIKLPAGGPIVAEEGHPLASHTRFNIRFAAAGAAAADAAAAAAAAAAISTR